MKTLVLLVVLGFSAVYAQEKQPKDINARKAKAIARIDERIGVMQSKKACISAASSKEDFKACHQKHKEEMKGMRDEYKARRKEHKHNRKNKRQQSEE